MSYITESWDHVAHLLGFETEEEMLKDLYVKQHYSMYDLARKLGYSQGNVRRRLRKYDIPLRPRGGKNRTGLGRLSTISNVDLGGKAEDVAEKFGVHLSTVFGERRRRKRLALLADSTVAVPKDNTV
jgi:hypothetical protein